MKKTNYVAFLRGINVGGHKLIKMDELRQAFESLGLQHVKSLIASGNILFEGPGSSPGALTHKIKAGLKREFGYEIGVILRTVEEVRAIVKSNPFKSVKVTPDVRLYVSLLAEAPKSDLQIPYVSPQQDFRILKVSEREVFSVCYVRATGGLSNSMNIIEKEYGKRITTRNWKTLVKIVED